MSPKWSNHELRIAKGVADDYIADHAATLSTEDKAAIRTFTEFLFMEVVERTLGSTTSPAAKASAPRDASAEFSERLGKEIDEMQLKTELANRSAIRPGGASRYRSHGFTDYGPNSRNQR